MKTFDGRVINAGAAKGEAVVLQAPLSFITDYDVEAGSIRGQQPVAVAGKVIVCPGGKGGTVDPYVAYEARRRGTAPLAILCREADPIIALSAMVMDVPLLDRFAVDILAHVRSGDRVEIENGTVTVR